MSDEDGGGSPGCMSHSLKVHRSAYQHSGGDEQAVEKYAFVFESARGIIIIHALKTLLFTYL